MKQNQNIRLTCPYFLIICFLLYCCKSKDYISYYNKVNEIDSIYRIAKQPEQAIKKYTKLFSKYRPLNQERIEEYETYIRVSDRYGKNFGGKKSLYRLIPLIAPYWRYKKEDPKFIKLYKKYGIDSLRMEQKVAEWKKKLDKKLIDSFVVAIRRDHYNERSNSSEIFENDLKNAELLKWTFKNYGYPSMQKIGLYHKDTFMPMGVIILHMADYDEYHSYFKSKILEYIKSGECPPRDYAAMVDRNNLHHKVPYTYGVYQGYENIKDSAKVNRNRKSIGLPSLKYRNKLAKDQADSLRTK
ncbi:hypothetical protein [Chryseobacterium kwangjuense]|uniref:Uncharacterized protein n=1 Tax=Chryseobacterium kwangjuense TaxID=267125 RepID=A0A135W3V8_9FLAO|nr:hypothetical protein [Chryseobacterium kwangjuense]KXH79557.1 hypothetical protein AU378_19500 [Chryseobacterium kwangjuense]